MVTRRRDGVWRRSGLAFSEIIVDETDTARYLWFGYARQAGVRLDHGEFDFRDGARK